MLIRIGKDRNGKDIKKKVEDVYLPIVTEIHAASDLHQNE